jgi:hypothetical protein
MSIAFDIRHLGGAHEIELFNRLPYALNDEIADDLEQGRRHVEWTWLAVHEDRLLGRLALWSRQERRMPRSSTSSTSTTPSPTTSSGRSGRHCSTPRTAR